MIPRDIRDTLAREMANALQRAGGSCRDWADMPERHREMYRRAMSEALRAVGVKVEGEVEPQVLESNEEDVF